MANFDVKPQFDTSANMIQPTDPAHADLFNVHFGRLYNNDAYLKEETIAGKITTRGNGNPITMNDTTNAGFITFDLHGGMSQDSTSGNNLLPYKNTYKSFTAGDTWTQYNVTGNPFSKGAGKYNYSCSGDFGGAYNYGLWAYDKDSNLLLNISNIGAIGRAIEITEDVANNTVRVDVVIGGLVKGTAYSGYIYPQISFGETKLDYEPYTNGASPNPDYSQEIKGVGDSGTIEVKTCGKNLLKPSLNVTTAYGVTCIDNGNGTYTLDGTATQDITFFLYNNTEPLTQLQGDLRLVGCPSGGSSNGYGLGIADVKWYGGNDIGNGITINTDKHTPNRIYIFVKSGVACNNLLFKPMVTTDTTATYDDFEPYTETQALIPISAPLYEGDYLEVYADGSGKIVRENVSYISDGSESGWFLSGIVICLPTLWGKLDSTTSYADKLRHTSKYANTTNLFDTQYNQVRVYANGKTLAEFKAELAENPIHFVIKLATPIIEPLTAEQVAEFKKLQTFNEVTSVFTEKLASMDVQACKNTDGGVIVGRLQKKLDTAENKVSELETKVAELEIAIAALG